MIINSPNLPVTFISCLLIRIEGSTTMLTLVFSTPKPTSPNSAATLTLAGKYLTASTAEPSKIIVLFLTNPNLFVMFEKMEPL